MIKHTSIAIASLALAACERIETVSQQFDTYDAAAVKNAIGEWKWLPQGLPPSAIDIRETHNIDTNEVWFSYKDPDLRVPAGCVQITPESATAPRITKASGESKRVASLASSLLESRDAPIYACNDEAYRYLVAVDRSSGMVVGWSTGLGEGSLTEARDDGKLTHPVRQ